MTETSEWRDGGVSRSRNHVDDCTVTATLQYCTVHYSTATSGFLLTEKLKSHMTGILFGLSTPSRK